MSATKIPGFTAELSLHAARGRYTSGWSSTSDPNAVIPAIPACRNCEWILDQCEIHGWRPRAVCNACARGYCYEEPPMPDPFPDPFPTPRF
jgi:hypothetical protein